MTRYAIVLVALLALSACKRGGDAGDAQPGDVQPVVGARTAVVATQPFDETVVAVGSVMPRAGHFASLAAPAPTRVAQVLVNVGETVTAGQPLVVFEQAEFDALLQSADTALQAAQRTSVRAQRLANEGIASRREVDQASADLAQARANEIAAKRVQELSTLRAPIAGVVTRLSAVLGASADPSQPLVDVTDPSALDVVLQLSAEDAARVHTGAAVTLAAGQGAEGEALGGGTVADVSMALDSATRTVAVRVQLSSPKRVLRVGETVMGRVLIGRREQAVVVPTESLVPDGEGYKVFVVDSGGMAHERAVTVGGRTSALVEITKGLKAGETVVTYGAFGVEDSAKIARAKP